jgi:hypothetical protein
MIMARPLRRSPVPSGRLGGISRLLAGLLGRIEGWIWRSAHRFSAALLQWLAARQRRAARAPRPEQCRFEALEPRVLLSADLSIGSMAFSGAGAITPGSPSSATVQLLKQGSDAIADAVRVKIYASPDATLDSGDRLLGQVDVPASQFAGPMGPLDIPLDTGAAGAAGSYHLIGVVDSQNAVTESDETNNQASAPQALQLGDSIGQVAPGSIIPSLTLTDDDGTRFTLTISGNGKVVVGHNAAGYTLEVTGSDAATSLTLTAAGGDGSVALGSVSVDGPIKSINAAPGRLNGPLTVNGAIRTLVLGDAANAAISSTGSGLLDISARTFSAVTVTTTQQIGTMALQAWTSPTPGSSRLQAGSVASLTSSGEMSADLALTGAGAGPLVLATLNVGGTVGNSQWNIGGRSGNLTLGSSGAGWHANITGALSQLLVRGDVSGLLAVSSLQLMQVSGKAVDFTLLVGANLGADAARGGSGANADSYGAGTLARLRIVGAMTRSLVAVGIDPVNGNYRDGDDIVRGTAANRVQELFIGGALSSDSNIIAPAFPATVTIAGQIVAPSAVPQLSTGAATGATPTLQAHLAHDSGASGSDLLSNDPTIAGATTDAAMLFAAIDPSSSGAAPTLNVSASLQPDGSFTLSAAQIDALAGGKLADGVHLIRLQAIGAGGMRSTMFDVAFTLDRTAPVLSQFVIAASDASNDAGTETGSAIVQLKGQADNGATVTLASQGLSVQAGANGMYVLPGVQLALGDNAITLGVTDAAGNSTSVTRTLSRVAATQPDAILTWNDITLRAIQLDVSDPPIATRTMAIESLAIYDALAAIEGTPAFMVRRSVSGPVSAPAAVAVAAHRVLSLAYPGQQAILDAALATSLAALPDDAAKDTGIALGLSIADEIWAIRSTDGYLDYVDDPGSTEIGQWRPTGPAYKLPDEPQWATLTPFAMTSPDEFRLPPPPALDTAAYAASVNEIKSLGSATSTTRTADQTQQAQFWADGAGSYTPPGHWNLIASQVAQAKGNSLSANARLFAQLNVALADAAIAAWDTKYTYNSWRPETAIQNAALDNNPATTADPDWRALLITPSHPEYASGHSTFSAAAAVVLGATFGENTSFTTTSSTLPGVTRSFTSFMQAADEAGRSRIYGGIHFEFTNAASHELGLKVGQAALDRFALTADTQAPSITLGASPAAVHTNLVLSGQILDNLSGVAAAQYRIDNGPLQDLSLDSAARFSISSGLALDGSADGRHSITVLARDAAGNLNLGVTRDFLLDTKAPALSLNQLPDGSLLTPGMNLAGAVDPTGSSLVTLNYRFDAGPLRTLNANGGDGGTFLQALDLADLGIGDHTLQVQAVDAAGNSSTLTRTVSLAQLVPFSVSSVTPTEGSDAVGTTFRPRVYFSRAVNGATLTADSYYATGPDGTRLDTTIVPAQDGSFAWLFFNSPMPGGSTVTVHLKGAAIRAAQDGAFLDADGDGNGGGDLSWSFTTVSTASVANTRLVGKVVDPGPDLQPMSFDDIRRGPDGVIHTADDVFVLPIAHVHVYVIGRPDLSTYTDANGNFSFDSMPAGDVKVAIDGRTATSPPAGVFFPEMVMDVQLLAGRTNTLMGSMGSLTERESNAERSEVYLPRVQTAALQQVSNTDPTTITVSAASAPALTAEQRTSLSLTVAPGSAVGFDGKVLDNVQVGINTVPPELVRDMLPAGVVQHTFDITIQAPGVDTFTTPLQITFPNVFNAAPGTQMNILSFDHTTGRLVISGTATVSADGKTAVSDAGSGVLAPGWHGLTPPGGSSDPPCDPTAPHTVDVPPIPVTSGLQDHFYSNDDGDFTLSFGNAATKLDPTKDPCDPVNMKATPLTVQIKLDGPAAKFLDGLADTTFDLEPGQQKNIKVMVKDLLANIKDFTKDMLYGTTVTITGWKAGTPGTLLINQKIYLYRFVDALDASLSDATGAFHKDGVVMLADTINDGAGGVQRKRPFEVDTGSEKPTLEVADTTNFPAIGAGTDFVFDPTQTSAAKAPLTTSVAIKTPAGATAGSLQLSAEATPINTIDLNLAGLKTALAAMVADGATVGGNVNPILFTKTEGAMFATQAQIDSFADDVIAGMMAKFTNDPTLAGGYAFGTATDAIKFNWATSLASEFATSKPTPADDGVDIKGSDIFNAIKNASFANFNAPQQDFIASDLINQSARTGVNVYVDNIFEYQGNGDDPANADPMSMTRAQAVTAFVKTAVHESVHTLGMPHSAQTYIAAPAGRTAEVQILKRTAGVAGNTFKLSFQGYDTADLPFDANAAAIQAALTGLTSIGAGNLTVSAGATADEVKLTFGGLLLGYDPPMITVSSSGALVAAVTSSVQGNANASLYAGVPNGTLDIMHGGFLDYTGALNFQPDLSSNTMQVSMHINWTDAQIQKLITYWGQHLAAGGAAQGVALGWYDSQTGSDSDLVNPVYAGPALAVALADGSALTGAVDLGQVALDAANPSASRTFRLSNIGNATLTLNSATITGAAGQFAGTTLGGSITLAPGAHYDYTVSYTPTALGDAKATLAFGSDDPQGPIQIGLAGHATSVAPRLSIAMDNNNMGGQDVGAGAKLANGLVTLRNDGQQPLSITQIALSGPDNAFTLSGVPAGLDAAHPLLLAAGQSLSLNVAFDPGKVALMRALLQVDSNDASNPHASRSIIGTGTGPVNSTLHWGNDYVALETTGRTGPDALRAVSDTAGNWSFFLPPNESLHYVIFDPVSGLISHSYDTSADAGQTTHLTLSSFGASTAPDSDNDGLPDDAELAIGTNAASKDTNHDGIDDFLAVQQGLNPLGNLALPTGVLSAVALQGTAEAVSVVAGATNPQQLTAYVATGVHGLAVIDASQANTPALLSELNLPGNSVDVAVDGARGVAAVAAGDGGLHLVDVSNPAAAKLLQTVAFPAPVLAVAVRDGLLFAAAGNTISVLDVNTGTLRQTLDFGGNAAGITSLALDGNILYAVDSANQLRSLSITGSALTALDMLALPAGGGKLFAGGGVAYIGAGNGGIAGFETADIRDPADLKLLSGVDNNGIGGTSVVSNGSGLTLAAGSSSFVFGAFQALDLMDGSDPTNTGSLITRYTLPAAPRDVTLANGLAFVADGSGGLQIVNYRALDSQGQAPSVAIAVDGIDADPATPGVQVLEGRTVRVLPTVADDVQLRNVELLVNGQVVSTDASFPYELIAQAPTIAAGGASMTLQVRATDTGGNASLSNLVTLTVVPDTFPPQIESVSVDEGARRFFVRSVDVQFDEPLDLGRLNASGATLVRAGNDGQFGTADDVAIPVHLDTRSFGQSLSVIADSFLTPGDYQFRLDPSIIADRAGNVLGAAVVRHFSIRPASDIRALSGVAAIPTAPSANPGQQIALQVPFDPATARLDLSLVDASGNITSTTLSVARWDSATGNAWFNVPYNAISGDAVVYGMAGNTRTDFADGTFPLQIVPLVTGVEVQSVAADGSSAVVLLHGYGFVEGHGSIYQFGSGAGAVQISDSGNSTGPDVQQVYDPALGQYVNGQVSMTVPLSDGVFGAISVSTDGGVSAGLSRSLATVQALALSGTPANAALPSANPGQAVTLTGSGLSTASDVLLRYTDYNGKAAMLRLNPVAAKADGSSATLLLPLEANGAFALQMFGSASQPTLQIVPTVSGFDENGNVYGSGFVEGATTYAFPGASVADSAIDTGPDVSYYYDAARGAYVFGGQASIGAALLPHHGAGNLTITTAGGTAAPLALNAVRPGSASGPLGALADVAVDPVSGALWTLDQANPGNLVRLDPATGAVLQSLALTPALGNQYTGSFAGLQVLPQAITLGGTAVPARSLLLFEGYPYNGANTVAALNPATGALITKLDLPTNYYSTAGVYDASSGHLFLLSHQLNQMIELNAATGAEIARIDMPLNVQNYAGMAIDPNDGNFWIGTYSSTSQLVKVDRTGKELRRIDLASQGVTSNEINGLAFNADGTLRVASQRGAIYTVRLDTDVAVPAPTLTQLSATALQGTPAQAGVAAANVGQVIELTGSNFGAGTQVLFNVRDNAGNNAVVAVRPQLINAAGTKLQVIVPDQASSGDVRVSNVASANLGYGSWPDAVHRQLSVQFTASAATAAINFADGGLEGLDNESWGLDNVSVRHGADTVFSDDFEAGAKANWVNPLTNADTAQLLTRYSGRFNNGSQTLNLDNLTAGETYTLRFDLYALDSWDGAAGNPDQISVSVDGTTLFARTVSNFVTSPQTLNATAGQRLQVVPTLAAIDGRPGGDNVFTLSGSGFMEGQSSVTVGGVALADTANANYPFDVSGARNNSMNVVAPRTLDGPVRITTDGGYAELPGAALPVQQQTQFSGITATARAGQVADPGQPSANAGQTIVLKGQGFTGSTLVQFQGRDDAGRAGTLTRTGVVGDGGKTLTVLVPALARTGAVSVLGSNASFNLQVVPLLRAVGGTLAPGATLLLDGSGLSDAGLTIMIDGKGVGNFDLRTVIDNDDASHAGQQLLRVTVPAGVGAGIISVGTSGGTSTLRAGAVALTQLPDQAAAADAGDTLATALNVPLGLNQGVQVTGAGLANGNDIDLQRIDLGAGDQLIAFLSGHSYSQLRIFDAAGTPLVSAYVAQGDSTPLTWTAVSGGSYYVGVSGYYNASYDPKVAGSGSNGSYSGPYTLNLQRLADGASHLSGIAATSGSGTPAQAGVASANAGQLITLNGSGLKSGERVVFSILDDGGRLSYATVTPSAVAADGNSLTVVVPDTATTGMVRLERDNSGVLLQVVPTLTGIAASNGGVYNGGGLTLTGSGFAEGVTSVLFGNQRLDDMGRSYGIDVYSAGHALQLSVPDGAPSGPIRVSTVGGTSEAAGPSITGIIASASSGTPANPAQASAVPGQLVTIAGTSLTAQTDVVFDTIDSNGGRSQLIVHPTLLNAAGTEAQVVVPATAVTGMVRVAGDLNGAAIALQIIPLVTSVEVQSVAADGSSAVVVLRGAGFVEGNGSRYRFGNGAGAQVVTDAGPALGPDVQQVYDPALGQYVNGQVTLTVPLSDGAFGAISVSTDGGTSAGLSRSLATVQALALSGTPANAALPSANPGQAVTITGSGLSTASDVLLRYTDYNGKAAMLRLNPVAAKADGSSATLLLPLEANGAFALQMFGSASQPTLQIVPTVSGFDENGNVYGSGFVEGATTYAFPGASVADSAIDTGPDVSYYYDAARGAYVFGGQASIGAALLPHHGAGNLTITTAGGTAAPLALNAVRPGSASGPLGALADVAVDPVSGALWTLDQANPGNLVRLDPATGAVLQSLALTPALGNQYTGSFAGLQVLPQAITLGGTAVPARSLLLFEGYPYNGANTVAALNPATGALITKLDLPTNYYSTAGVYDASSGHLFLLSHQLNQMIELNAATGAEIARIDMPLNVQNYAGMAIDPNDGNFWIGTYSSTSQLVKVDRTGKELRRIDLASQGVTSNEINGLAFNADGTLRVASQRGAIYTVRLDTDVAVPAPTLTQLSATALQGTPAQAGVAAANVGQVIELTGSNFGAGTQVLFNVRDNAGNNAVVAVRPQLINAAGTKLQVIVPDQASSGDVRVSNVASANLGYGSWPDAVHRQLSVQFTASAATAAINFADGGLEGLDNESWGLDNVSVRHGADTVFSDDFEAGAKANWVNPLTNADTAQLLTRYSGRFNNGSQTLNLDNLTAGETYTLRFDLYALDSWDGAAGNPDQISVSVDGTTLFARTVSNFVTSPQTLNATAGQRLQIVPTLAAIDGRPGGDNVFTLSGSGFMEGQSSVTVGGVALTDTANANYPFDVSGARNNSMNVVAPRTLDGPVRITTDGGYAEIPGYMAPQLGVSAFTGLAGTAETGGVPADPAKAAASPGRTIVLSGQGFTGNTLVQFQGRDDAGHAGTLTRTGSVSDGGHTLTVIVPALATSGDVTVLGSGTSFPLQIVPVLRSVGGNLTPGATLLLDGSGLSAADLAVSIDGHAAAITDLRTVIDNDDTSHAGQQLLRVTVSAGVSAGVITVSSAGGGSTLRRGAVAVSALADVAAPSDAGSTLAGALPVTLGLNQSVRITGAGLSDGNDIDLHRITLAAGDQLSVFLSQHSYSQLRIFDAAGLPLVSGYISQGDSTPMTWTAATAGDYYVGVSGYYNTSYDPNVAGSGSNGGYSGPYQLNLQRLAAGSGHLAGITSSAASGTAAQAGVAAANAGQTITLNGAGFTASDRVVFSMLDDGGRLYFSAVVPADVAADGNSLTVVVPAAATTGAVRLQRDNSGVLLQVVPTLDAVAANNGSVFHGGGLTLTGSGFAEGNISVAFGNQKLNDMGRSYGIDVYNADHTLNLTVPDDAPSGPVSVSTLGGTSATVGLAVTSISATAGSGTPANAAVASALPGQTITINGSQLSAQMDVVFTIIDSNGSRSEIIVRPTSVNAAATQALVKVPGNAVSGSVRVAGDSNGAAIPLQILPVLTGIDVQSVAADGSSAVVTLRGSGLVEGNGSSYRFGTGAGAQVVTDPGANLGPDVQQVYDAGLAQYLNGQVVLTVPLTDGAFGAITVTTDGGTSASLSTGLGTIQASAASGTPADAAQASANVGQVITVTGSGLSTGSTLLLRYVDYNGKPSMLMLHPSSALADGSAASVKVPTEANGAYTLDMLGSTARPLLQVVPTVSRFTAAGTLYGSGFVEGASSYAFPGASVSDSAIGAGADVTYYYDSDQAAYIWSGQANLDPSLLPHYGSGNVRVTTAGGTSAALALGTLRPGSDAATLGALADVAIDPASGALWALDQANPGKLVRVDPASGALLQTVALSPALGNQYTGGYGGLQVLPQAISLGGVAVPSGSLLLFEGYPYNGPNTVAALNPATGALITRLDLPATYYSTAGVYDAASGHLFLLSHQLNQMVELNPATGAEIARIDLPLNVQNYAGMAIDPVDGNFWIGSYNGGGQLVKINHSGAELRRVDAASQGVNGNEISGLAFAADGSLRVASTQGVIYRVAVA